MKSILLITVLLSFVINSYSQADTTLPVKIVLKLLSSDSLTVNKKRWAEEIKQFNYQVTTDSIKLKTFNIELSIKNTSKDSITIWLMSCSWYENFEVNNDYMYISPWECDKNFRSPFRFKGGETKTFNATLEKSIKFDYPCYGCDFGNQIRETKLGLIVTKVRYIPKLDIWTQNFFDPIDKSVWRIIWSNPLYLIGEQF